MPSPLRSVTSTRTLSSPAVTVTVTRLPGTAEPPCHTLLVTNSLANGDCKYNLTDPANGTSRH